MQLLRPFDGVNEPGMHAVGSVARAKHRLPAGHATHAVAPVADWYVPASHAAHTLSPALAVIVPGLQRVADVAPVGQAEPAGQVVQSPWPVAPGEAR